MFLALEEHVITIKRRPLTFLLAAAVTSLGTAALAFETSLDFVMGEGSGVIRCRAFART